MCCWSRELTSTRLRILGAPFSTVPQNGHVDVVKLMLDYGADINKTPNNGANPLLIASQKGHEEIVRMLKEYISTRQQKSLVTENIKKRYERPNITLRSSAFSQLNTEDTSKINKIKDRLYPPGKLGGKRKTRKSTNSQKNRKSMKNKHSVRK